METPPQQCSRINRAGQSRILPPPIQQLLASNPLWESVCERMGHNPHEWESYQPAPFDREAYDQDMAQQELEQATIRAEYDRAIDWVVRVVRYNPGKVKQALDLRGCAGLCNCECCYAW